MRIFMRASFVNVRTKLIWYDDSTFQYTYYLFILRTVNYSESIVEQKKTNKFMENAIEIYLNI